MDFEVQRLRQQGGVQLGTELVDWGKEGGGNKPSGVTCLLICSILVWCVEEQRACTWGRWGWGSRLN